MQVWVVRDSCCGNGSDDKGVVLGVFTSKEAADTAANKATKGTITTPTWSISNYYEIEVEGPFELDTFQGE